MRTTLDTLPAAKRRELAHVVEVLRDTFAQETSTRKADRLREGKLQKIILFGSYARGDWVDDPVGRYFSDYDLLVVVSDEDLTDVPDFWSKAEKRFLGELSAGQILRTPVSLIYHSLDDVNVQLSRGRYFFTDIVKDGIVLYDDGEAEFLHPEALPAQEASSESKRYYEDWFESADDFYQSARDAISRGKGNLAAFLLHQATERFYHCLFLVRTLYVPKTHNLARIRALCEDLEPTLQSVWPTESKFQKRAFELLRAAYVKARYSRHYRITSEELAWLDERVTLLQDLVRAACERRIAELQAGADATA